MTALIVILSLCTVLFSKRVSGLPVCSRNFLTSTIKHQNVSILQRTSKGEKQNKARKKIKTNFPTIQDAVKPLLILLGKIFIILPDLDSK